MFAYLGRKVPSLFALLVVTSLIAFMLPRLAPGDAASAIAGPDATLEQIEAIRIQLGLDRPIFVQYFDWMGGVLSGDMGTSYVSRRPVAELIGSRVLSTVELALAATVLMVSMGTAMGVLIGSPGRGKVKLAIEGFVAAAVATPPHVTGLILILVLGILYPVFPISGEVSVLRDPVRGLMFLALPAFALALPASAMLARLIAARMKQVWQEDFVDLARAKGVPQGRIVVSHVLRNSWGTAAVAIGLRFGDLLSGAVVIEAIFARNGLGMLGVTAAQSADYQVVQVIILGAVAIAAICNLLADIAVAGLDPRVRLEG